MPIVDVGLIERTNIDILAAPNLGEDVDADFGRSLGFHFTGGVEYTEERTYPNLDKEHLEAFVAHVKASAPSYAQNPTVTWYSVTETWGGVLLTAVVEYLKD